MSKVPLALPLLFCKLRSNDGVCTRAKRAFICFVGKSSSGIASKARILMQIGFFCLFFLIRTNIYRVLYGDKADKGLLETDGANWSDDGGEKWVARNSGRV